MNPAARFHFNDADWASWGKHVLIFVGPSLLIFLVAIQGGTPVKQALMMVYGSFLGAVIDWLRKFLDSPSA